MMSATSQIRKDSGRAVHADVPADIVGEFWQLWQEYQDKLYWLCLKMMNANPTEAEDALSQACIKAWEKVQKYAGKIGNFKGWLFQLTRNLCIDLMGKRDRGAAGAEDIEWVGGTEVVTTASVVETPEQVLEDEEKRAEIARVIGDLPEATRETFVLHYYQDLSHEEIAERQGISYDSVCKRISRARKKLMERLRGYFCNGDAFKPLPEGEPRAHKQKQQRIEEILLQETIIPTLENGEIDPPEKIVESKSEERLSREAIVLPEATEAKEDSASQGIGCKVPKRFVGNPREERAKATTASKQQESKGDINMPQSKEHIIEKHSHRPTNAREILIKNMRTEKKEKDAEEKEETEVRNRKQKKSKGERGRKKKEEEISSSPRIQKTKEKRKNRRKRKMETMKKAITLVLSVMLVAITFVTPASAETGLEPDSEVCVFTENNDCSVETEDNAGETLFFIIAANYEDQTRTIELTGAGEDCNINDTTEQEMTLDSGELTIFRVTCGDAENDIGLEIDEGPSQVVTYNTAATPID